MVTEFEREFEEMLDPVTIGNWTETTSSEGFPEKGWEVIHKTQAYIERQSASPFQSAGSEQIENQYDGFFPIEDSSGNKMNLHSGLRVAEGYVESSEFGSSIPYYEIEEEGEDYIGYHQEVTLIKHSND